MLYRANVKVMFSVHSALQSSLGYRNCIIDIFTNYTLQFVLLGNLAMEDIEVDGRLPAVSQLPFHFSFIPKSSGDRVAPENSEYLWDFKPACSYCYALWMLFSLSLIFNNYLRISPRDLPQDRTLLDDRDCGMVWADGWSSGHPQCFGTSPLNNCRTLKI